MPDRWYYARDRQRRGPFTFRQFRQMAAARSLAPADMVWNEGATYWVSASEVPGLFDGMMTPPPPDPATSPRPEPSPSAAILFRCRCGRQIQRGAEDAAGPVHCPACGTLPQTISSPVSGSDSTSDNRPQTEITPPQAITSAGEMRRPASVDAVPAPSGSPPIPVRGGRPVRSTGGPRQVSVLETVTGLASEHRLGALAAQYRSSVFLRVSLIIGSAIVFFIPLGALVRVSKSSPALASWLETVFPLILVGVAVYVIGGLAFCVLTRRWWTVVFVFDKGLVCVTPSSTDVLRWDEVREIRVSTETAGGETRWCYTLLRSDGREITLSRLKRLEELADTIFDNTHDRLLRTALAAYRAGRPVLFGPSVRVDRASLTLGKTTLPWSEVQDVRPPDKAGKISVVRKNSWFKLSAGHVAEIPNYTIMLALVREILTSRWSDRTGGSSP